MMEFLNELQNFNPSTEQDFRTLRFAIENLLLLISPFAPHIAEELWSQIGNEPSILEAPWPQWDEELSKEEEYELVIQINGKVRAKTRIPQGLTEEAIKEKVLSEPRVIQALSGKDIKKIIIAKKRLVNIVT